ncbi:MAG: sulfatase, partial [Bacteroidetes bacterium]|nr:sulfatase [Bacteroidota bacterium]
MRKEVIVLIALCSAFASCTNQDSGAVQDREKLPNILIVSADDLAYNSVGAFGCKVKDITPNIDKFATEGIRFTNAHVNTPVCQPCRQSWLTGRFPHSIESEGFEPINVDVSTLPEQLKSIGYLNGILGKEIHHQPKDRFFWDFIPFVTEKDSIWRSGHSRNPSMFYEYSSIFFKMAKDQNKPFFLSANSHDPHRPFIGSRQDTLTWGDNMPPVSRQYSPEEVEVMGYLPDIKDVRKEVAQYYGSVYRGDQSIGGVLDALEESGLSDNTVVIFLSDHGAAFPFSKAQCYLNSSKTPLIIRWPEKIRPGSVDSTHFVTGIDLMPTIMEIAGLPLIPKLDGQSFLPLLFDKKQRDREYAYSTFYQIFAKKRFPMRCLQNEDFGYIYNFWSDHQTEIRGDATGGLTWRAMIKAAETDLEIAKRVELYKYRVPEEFYNFKNDPDGLVNLVNDPAYAKELMKFRKKMLEMMKKYNDPAYEAFRDRNDPGVITNFMEAQREKAKRTKPVER